MKKQFFGLLTAGLLLSACSQEDVMAPQGDGNVTFTVSLEQGIMSRAISDGTTATDLTYEVYNQAGDQLITSGTAQFTSTTTPVEVKVTLPMGNYKIAFWAQSPQATAYTATDLRNVTIDYDGILNNDENLDAFFNATEFNTSVSQPVSVVLRRPFAQINVGIDGDVDYTQSQMVVKNGGFNALNVLTGVASGDETEITFEMANLPTEKLTVSETEYTYLSMTYLLVNTASTTVDLELTLTGDKQYTYDNVPVQRNHRTNILGKVENFEVVFQVTKDSNYDGDLDGNAESEEPEEPEADEVTYSNLTANYSDGTVNLSVDFEGDAQKVVNPQFVLTPKVVSRAAGEITVDGSVSGNTITGEYKGELTATAYTVSFQVNGEPVELEGDPETPSFDVPAVTEPAEPVTYSFSAKDGQTTNSDYSKSGNITINGIKWVLDGNGQFDPWRIGGKSTNTVKADRALYSQTPLPGNINTIKIEFAKLSGLTVFSFNIIVARDASFEDVVHTFTPDIPTANSSAEVTRPDNEDWTNCYYKFLFNVSAAGTSNGYIEISNTTFTGTK